ncbi:hypothetical protein BY996DRAFT_8471415 [Phakopsora pachyrhizi]|nr:hypothetical protein BY996DRAFT_8471415 [Phakopsora pachyrhizi]
MVFVTIFPAHLDQLAEKKKADQSEMEAGYEDLKNCIQETKKQIWWPRHIEGLKKIEKTLENDLSSIMFEGIDDNCFKTLSEVLSSYENVLKPGRPISSLDTEHWKEIELGFLKAHKKLEYNKNIFKENFSEYEKRFSQYGKRFSKYEEFISENQSILKNVKDIEKPLPNVYKIIVTNPKNTSLKNFIECTFAYHVHNYLKRYKKNFKLGNLVKEKEEVFEAFFKVFQNILKVINALEESFNLERGIRRKIYCLSPFLLELQNLMPSPDFNKYQYIGNQNKISFKTANSKSFLKSCYFELNKSGVSNIFMTLNDLKQEYGLLKTQMRFWKYKCKFSKKSIDSWHRTIKNYMEFSESILKDIIQEEEASNYWDHAKTFSSLFLKSP